MVEHDYEHEHEQQGEEFVLPERLAVELAELYSPQIDVPADVDEAVLAGAVKRLGRVRHRPVVIGRIVPYAAAAAVLVAVGVWLFLQHQAGGPSGAAQAAIQPADVDRNGRVDILDAFALARHVEAGTTGAGAWDFDGDGAVGQADVDVVALRAVALRPATRGDRS